MADALLLLAMACGNADGEAEPTSPPATGGPPLAERYADNETGFTLDYPTGWVVEELPGQPAVLVALFQRQSAGDGFAENVNVLLEELPSGVSLERYTEANVESLERAFSNFEVLEDREEPIGAVPAHWIRYDADEQGRRLSFLQAWLVDGDRGFVLSYTGEGESFETYLTDAEAILRSFRLT